MLDEETLVLDELIAAIRPTDTAAAAAAASRHSTLAMPSGSLGRIEQLGIRLAAIAGRCPPPVPTRPVVIVAAADHGVHAQGVSDWPQAVTSAMVRTVAAGGAAVNAFARTVGADIRLVDVGTVSDRPVPHGVVDRRIRAGTRDLTGEPAMTPDECRDAISVGAGAAREMVAAGADLVAVGDLGIGNTTASACLVAAFTGAAPGAVTGPGANHDTARVGRKVEVVAAALRRHGADHDPLGVLASLGGLEHAALVGVMLASAAARVPVLLDGAITDAAALAAVALAPAATGYLVASHVSTEAGARVALDHVRLPALLDLRLRLGEGTGALLAVPLVQAAARVLSETAVLDDVISA